ncbi:hypothetical protein Fcan01_12086 [Folsomia candida]|uniref:Transmembrane protein n=1 Tax=Folsomia candida TaxID=158441 RepID=A0A226E5J7_FOLCA|nr:hypothetical protein Fcan01_12086 [Folsomia candida]
MRREEEEMDNRVDHHQKSVGEEGSSWKRNKSCSSIFSLVSSLVVFLLFLSPGVLASWDDWWTYDGISALVLVGAYPLNKISQQWVRVEWATERGLVEVIGIRGSAAGLHFLRRWNGESSQRGRLNPLAKSDGAEEELS